MNFAVSNNIILCVLHAIKKHIAIPASGHCEDLLSTFSVDNTSKKSHVFTPPSSST